MTEPRTLLAAAFALTLTTGSAYAESQRYSSGPTWQPYPASVAGRSGSNAPPVPGSSSAPLSALPRDWDRAGFSAPSKPAQSRVYGRDGYMTSGPGYAIMVSLIRSAVQAAREGRDQDALAKIEQVRTLLDRRTRERAAPSS